MRSRAWWLVLLALAPASCLLNWDALREPDAGGVDSGEDIATNDVGSDAPQDVGKDTSCTIQLSINEVQADGIQGASDEFVEIRNGAPCGGSLLNWNLRYSSAAGSNPSQLWLGQAGDTIGPAGPTGYVILGGYAFQAPDGGALIGRISSDLNGALSKSGGGVGLFAPGGTLVDGVAYETLTTQAHPFIQPSNAGAEGGAPNPPSGKSIARKPDGKNTSTNATDFQVSTPTPGSSN